MGFFFVILFWTVIWLGWNVFAPADLKFDPYPAFVFWLFISNMIQIFLMPLIMIGQNLQAKHSEARAETDYEVNIKAEREIEAILIHLENQNETMMQILEKLDKKWYTNITNVIEYTNRMQIKLSLFENSILFVWFVWKK